MRQAKVFFIVCAGLLCLALAYHLGARSAGAQAPGNPVVALGVNSQGQCVSAATANGNVYITVSGGWAYSSNIFGSATPAQSISIGQLKAKYATPAPAGK